MAPLAKPMSLSRRERNLVMLPRSSSLEGSTISDTLRSEGGGGGADAWASGSRREGTAAAGQTGQVCQLLW